MRSSSVLSVSVVILLVCSLVQAQCPNLCRCSTWTVSCKHAQLTYVPAGKLQNGVTKFDLADNKISTLRNDSFVAPELSSLETLVLANNNIRYIEVNSLRYLKNLCKLDLSGNDISYIDPEIFLSNTNLITLNLTYNVDLKLPENGYNLPELVKLELEECRLKRLPANFFTNMTNIKFLYLSRNEISFLEPTNFKHLTNLEELDLSDNWFKVLQRDLLELHSSTKVGINMNPWICDCDFKKALDLFSLRGKHKSLVCMSPDQLRGMIANATMINELFQCDAASTSSTTAVSYEAIADLFEKDNTESSREEKLANVMEAYFDDREVEQAPPLKPHPLVNASTDDEDIALFASTQPQSWFGENEWWIICGSVILLAVVVVAIINKQVNRHRKKHLLSHIHFDDEA